MRSFDVPPKHSAPLTRGLFCELDFLRRRERKSPAGERGSRQQAADEVLWLRAKACSLKRDSLMNGLSYPQAAAHEPGLFRLLLLPPALDRLRDLLVLFRHL